ncbi:zeta toxin family protein, partial [Francisella tularensis subsp. holarctica]|nr:zeta toxin family protein [Francisella tularensis subsp. holarctica]
ISEYIGLIKLACTVSWRLRHYFCAQNLIQYCVEKRYNILFENGFTDHAATQEIPNIVNKFNLKKIELYIVATPKKLSH